MVLGAGLIRKVLPLGQRRRILCKPVCGSLMQGLLRKLRWCFSRRQMSEDVVRQRVIPQLDALQMRVVEAIVGYKSI